jgi:hypothetical protein
MEITKTKIIKKKKPTRTKILSHFSSSIKGKLKKKHLNKLKRKRKKRTMK